MNKLIKRSLLLTLSFTLVLVSLSSCSGLVVSESEKNWTKVWEITDLPSPESVVYNPSDKTVYVSHQNYAGKDGTGSIGKITLSGKVIEKEWIKGLDRPKGIAILRNRLFVSDVKVLVEIDIKQSKIIKKHKVKDANFLNDVVIDKDENIFVSDMFNSSIYKMDKKGTVNLWLKTPRVENPNGLLIVKNKMLVGAWGSFNNKNPMSAPKGNFLEINMLDKGIKRLTNQPLGNLDGVQVFKKNRYLVSDWISGDIYLSNNKAEFVKVIDLEQSVGDIAYLPKQKLLLVPMAKQGKVIAYKN